MLLRQLTFPNIFAQLLLFPKFTKYHKFKKWVFGSGSFFNHEYACNCFYISLCVCVRPQISISHIVSTPKNLSYTQTYSKVPYI